MCGMNHAFDRELIVPAMYLGLMGDSQPIGRYYDMWNCGLDGGTKVYAVILLYFLHSC